MNCFILATCRKPELLPYTELVFRTLRIGFPTANVKVFLNGNAPESVTKLATDTGCSIAKTDTIHHEWLQMLAMTEQEPFYVVDTDMVFYSPMERFVFTAPLAGWRIPEWKDEFTNAITRSRLHTSVLYINPGQVRQKLKEYDSQFPNTVFNPRINPFYPVVLPFKQQAYFYDTCGLLYHAIGGQSFTDEQLDCYFHFNFGTISDIVLPHLSNGDAMTVRRQAILDNPELGRGLWNEYQEYIESRQPHFDGKDVIAPIDPDDGKDALQWNIELCQGNKEAMTFNDMWYNYVHAIDDLVDTLEDGRPVMSKEQMISLFFKAAIIYNCPFFVKHRELLFPIVLQVTNTFQDSVAWERSPKAHLRAMGDVFRTCGNEMFIMVALICGGEAHMRQMSMRIKERDWLGQHTADGKPK